MPKQTDALTMLKADHATVKKLFNQFEGLTPRAEKTMAKTRDRIVEELSIHASIEEEVFYPVVMELVPDLQETVLEGLEEHRVAERLLADVQDLDPADRFFRPRMAVLIESVRHHVTEEEGSLFPAVRKVLDRRELLEIGDALEQARQVAPTRAHPHGPDQPPLNVLGDLAMGVLDRLRSVVTR